MINTAAEVQKPNTDKKKVKNLNFGIYLALTMSSLVAIAIVITALFAIRCFGALAETYGTSADNLSNFISGSVVASYVDAKENSHYKNLTILSQSLRRSGYVRYIYSYDNNTKVVNWSSEPSFFGRSNDYVVKNYLTKINKESLAQEKTYSAGSDTVVIGMLENKIQPETYKHILSRMQIFVLVFVILSIIVAIYVGLKVSTPLTVLLSGVKDFGRGNFARRLNLNSFQEINELTDTYNIMASELNELYESLETKIEERTRELEEANIKLKETQTMMVHSEKMRSLGELVAGIAHEINNPINFIYGNIMILDNYQKDLLTLIEKYSEIDAQIDTKSLNDINGFKEEIDLEFLKEDIGDLIKSCIEGVERTKNIVLDLKNFSRMDEMVFSECNIPKEIDTTLSILNNKLKNRITIHKNYAPDMPKIEAYGGQLNQVFMNIIDNAQGAIKDKGDIFISAKKLDEENVIIEFEDNGCGIEEENLHKIFEPFFTTKPVGQGTGLGMSIVYKVIEAHNGKITAESEYGKGTKITIILPINHKQEDNESNA